MIDGALMGLSTLSGWVAAVLAGVLTIDGSTSASETSTDHSQLTHYLELVGAGDRNPVLDRAIVEVIRPVEKGLDLSIIMIPGGGLSSLIYRTGGTDTTGWSTQFAAAGFTVYLTHPPARPEGKGKWTPETVWSLWGLGNRYPRPYDGSRAGPDMASELHQLLGVGRHPMATSQLSELLDRAGPSFVLAHSAGGRAMFNESILNHPNLKGTVAVETLRCPTNAAMLKKTYADAGRSFFSLWGDHLDRGRPPIDDRYQSCREAAEMIEASGGRAKTVLLPIDAGVTGNSHLLMLEDNADDLASRLIRWLIDTVEQDAG